MAAMFADDSFRFDELGTERTLAQLSAVESSNQPSNWPEQNRYDDRSPDHIFPLADEVANDGIDAAPEDDPQSKLLISHAFSVPCPCAVFAAFLAAMVPRG